MRIRVIPRGTPACALSCSSLPLRGAYPAPNPPSSATRHLPQVPSGGHRQRAGSPCWPHLDGAATHAAVHAEAGEAAGAKAKSNCTMAACSASIIAENNVTLQIRQQLFWRDYTHQLSSAPDLMVLLRDHVHSKLYDDEIEIVMNIYTFPLRMPARLPTRLDYLTRVEVPPGVVSTDHRQLADQANDPT